MLEKRKVNWFCLPPVLLVMLLIGSAAIHYWLFGGFSYSSIRWLLGTLIIFLSFLLIACSVGLFIKLKTPFRPDLPPTALVQTGCYRFSRNPMYLAMFAIFLGCSIISGSVIMFVAALLFAVIIHFGVILKEERYLETRYGQAYRRYKQNVRRWL